jgi:hypothetical protein
MYKFIPDRRQNPASLQINLYPISSSMKNNQKQNSHHTPAISFPKTQKKKKHCLLRFVIIQIRPKTKNNIQPKNQTQLTMKRCAW